MNVCAAIRMAHSVEKSWHLFFGTVGGALLVDFMSKGTMIKAEAYCNTLKKLRNHSEPQKGDADPKSPGSTPHEFHGSWWHRLNGIFSPTRLAGFGWETCFQWSGGQGSGWKSWRRTSMTLAYKRRHSDYINVSLKNSSIHFCSILWIKTNSRRMKLLSTSGNRDETETQRGTIHTSTSAMWGPACGSMVRARFLYDPAYLGNFKARLTQFGFNHILWSCLVGLRPYLAFRSSVKRLEFSSAKTICGGIWCDILMIFV